MTNLTQEDNYKAATTRLVAQVMREKSFSLTDATPSYKQLTEDVKSAKVKTSGAATTVWVSYYDGENDYLPGTTTAPTKANAAADDRSFALADGESIDIVQELEFNRIHGEITGGSGSVTVKSWPGGGKGNNI